MLALAALALAAHSSPALARSDATHWQAPPRTNVSATARPSPTRIKALEQAVRRLGPDERPASYASAGPSGL